MNGHKNRLFCDTVRGAKASAAVYSVVETAKANSLDPHDYLEYLLCIILGLDFHNRPELLDDCIPWSEKVMIYFED